MRTAQKVGQSLTSACAWGASSSWVSPVIAAAAAIFGLLCPGAGVGRARRSRWGDLRRRGRFSQGNLLFPIQAF